ncbi:GNAT family N-acetyltransferase [Bacteroidota bacterium]
MRNNKAGVEMIPLSGEKIKLRAIEPSDLDLLYEWENDPENWLVSNTTTPFSRHILQKYIENAHQDIYEARQLRLMIDRIDKGHTPEIVGTIDLFDFDPLHLKAGVGILIARKENRMKGLASEALSILIDYAFHRLHLHQLYCNISENNQQSLELFKKFGFKETGKKIDWIRQKNKWINVYILQKINPEDV